MTRRPERMGVREREILTKAANSHDGQLYGAHPGLRVTRTSAALARLQERGYLTTPASRLELPAITDAGRAALRQGAA